MLLLILKYRLRTLERRFHAVDNRKNELEKLLSDFHYRHSVELGDLLLEILTLRTQLYLRDKSKYEDAKKDEKQFRDQLLADKKQHKYELSNDEKKELKKKFRGASVLCHPDKVDEKFSTEAEEVFIRLKNAYDSNNLRKVAAILNNLERGNYFKPKSETVSEKEVLMAQIQKLRGRIKSMEKDIALIKKSYEYKKIVDIDNWDAYFKEMKTKLEAELEKMKQQLKETKHGAVEQEQYKQG